MTYLIAEVGGNHNGDPELALEYVRAAKLSGADAVKFQIYKADKLVCESAEALPQAKGYSRQIDRFRDLELTDRQWLDVINACKEHKIDFMASCFDIRTLYKFEPFMPSIKIASGDLTYKHLIETASGFGKPVILSTGMATFEEVMLAARWVPPHLLTVMHCVSLYPCPDESVNLDNLVHLMSLFPRVGYSDHAEGITACLAAISLGANIVEKHFTLDKTQGFGDHPHSAEPEEFRELVIHARRIEKMRGYNWDQRPDRDNAQKFRRGGYAATTIHNAQMIDMSDILAIRPATQKMPHEYEGIASRDFEKGESLDG